MNLKNKKILVTGGRGFLGQALVPLLKKECIDVLTFGSKDYDLREQSDVRKLLRDTKPEIVIHLAVDGGGIGYMKENPGSVYENNIMMNTLIQKESRMKNVEKFVGIGSVCSYPKFTPVPFKEENLWNGYPEETNAPYGLAKKMMMVQSQAYREQYGFNAIHLMPVNLYGPNDDFDLENSHVVPALIRKMVDAKKEGKKSIELWGTGSASREFLYVDDCAKGILMATKYYDKPEPINLGAGSETTIKDLAETTKELVNFKGKIIWDINKPDGQPRRCLDTSKAEREFGFKAQTSLEKGLRKTINWYISHHNNL